MKFTVKAFGGLPHAPDKMGYNTLAAGQGTKPILPKPFSALLNSRFERLKGWHGVVSAGLFLFYPCGSAEHVLYSGAVENTDNVKSVFRKAAYTVLMVLRVGFFCQSKSMLPHRIFYLLSQSLPLLPTGSNRFV